MAVSDTDGTSDDDAAQHRASHIQIVARNQSFRRLSRSPHPYRRRKADPFASETASSGYSSSIWVKDQRTSGDSGTDADDEGNNNGILKSLPAPPGRKGSHEASEYGGSTGVSDRLKFSGKLARKRSGESSDVLAARGLQWSSKRWRVEVFRRVCETAWILTLVATSLLPEEARFVAGNWSRGRCLYTIMMLF